MTYGAKSRSLPLLPPLFENNEAGGDFLAKEALDAVKDAEQKAAGILDTAAARCAAIRQDAAQKADKLKTERMQKAKADLAAAKQSAETAAAAEQRTAQQKTAAQKSAAKQRERNPRYPRGHHRLTRRQHERRGSPYGGNAYEAHQHLCAQEPS